MDRSNIADALMAIIENAALGYEVVFENRDATPSLPYLQVSTFFPPPVRITLQGAHQIQGLLQVTVVIENDAGSLAAMRIAEQVTALFTIDTLIEAGDGHVAVTELSTIGPGMVEASAYRLPVSIPFRAFTSE